MGISLKGLYDYERLQKQNAYLADELHSLQSEHERDQKDYEKSCDYWTGLLSSMKDDIATLEKANRLLRRENEKQRRKIKELESREHAHWTYQPGRGWVPDNMTFEAIAQKTPDVIVVRPLVKNEVPRKDADKHAN